MPLLDETRSAIAARLAELKPLVDEHAELEAAAAALNGAGTTVTTPQAPKVRGARTSRKRTPAASGQGKRERGRPKGSGKRAAEALALVKANPGITIPEIAEKMGIKQNYLYRVLPGLAEAGLVVKEGQGWRPAA